MNNGDMIRSMSNKELAEFIQKIKYLYKTDDMYKHKKGVLNWLNQECSNDKISTVQC